MRSEDKIGGPRLNLDEITYINVEYTQENTKANWEGGIATVAALFQYGWLAASVANRMFGGPKYEYIDYCAIRLKDHGDDEYLLVTEPAVVKKIIRIINDQNYFGYREPNRSFFLLRGLQWTSDWFLTILWGFIYIVLGFTALLAIYCIFMWLTTK